MSNRYTKLTPSKFNPLSLQEQMMIPLAKQKQHDNAIAALAEQSVFDVNSLPVDSSYVTGFIDNYKKRIRGMEDSILDRGINSGVTKDLIKIKAERDDFLSNSGVGGKAKKAYDEYQENLKYIMSNNTILDKQAAIEHAKQRYAKSGGVEAGADYTPFYGGSHFDAVEYLTPIMSQIQPTTIRQALTGDGELSQYITKKYGPATVLSKTMMESITQDEYAMSRIAAQLLKASPQAMSFYNDQAAMQGVEDPEAFINQQIAAAAGTMGEMKKRDDYSVDESVSVLDGGKATKETHKDDGSYMVSDTGRRIEVKDFFKDMDSLRDAAGDPENSTHSAAARILDKIERRVISDNQGVKDLFNKETTGKLPSGLIDILELSEWDQKTKSEFRVGEKEISVDGVTEKIQQTYMITPKTGEGDNQKIHIYEVSDDFMNNTYLNNSTDMGTKNQLETFKKSAIGDKQITYKTSISLNNLTEAANNLFETEGAPSETYTIMNLSKTKEDTLHRDVLNTLSSTDPTNNYNVLSISKASANNYNKFKRVQLDSDNTATEKEKVLSLLGRSGGKLGIQEFKVNYAYYDYYNSTPAIRISYNVKDMYYKVDIGLTETHAKSGVESGQMRMLNHLRNFGGASGKSFYDAMYDEIRYKDVIENYSVYSFDNSKAIKNHIGNTAFKDEDLNVVMDNENRYMLYTRNSKDKKTPTSLKWSDFIDKQDLIDHTAGEDDDVYKGLIQFAIDEGYFDEKGSMTTFDINGDEILSDEKIDNVLMGILDWDMEVKTKNKRTLMNILNTAAALKNK